VTESQWFEPEVQECGGAVNFHQLKSIKRDRVLEGAIHRDFHQMLAIADLFSFPDIDKADKLTTLDRLLLDQRMDRSGILLGLTR
jgi:hypothetical protein